MPARTVIIVDYRESWRTEFEVIAADVREALGNAALRVDHIGSTAVPGLCAKDVIDIQVTVAALDVGLIECMLAAGFTKHTEVQRYDHVPPGLAGTHENWSKLFFMQRADARRCNIHVRQAGRPNQRYPLLFRNFLLADRRTAEAYGQLKRRLASSLANADAYPDVKDPAVDLIYLAAERWAIETQWRSSDA